jgi:hypothetical protein
MQGYCALLRTMRFRKGAPLTRRSFIFFEIIDALS